MPNTTTENEKTPEVALDTHEALLTTGVEIKPQLLGPLTGYAGR